MRVAEFELDLEAFEGPFDLLLTLVLKEEIDLAEVDVAGIVLAFVETMLEIADLAEKDPQAITGCPRTTPVGRLDEVAAARKPDLASLG